MIADTGRLANSMSDARPAGRNSMNLNPKTTMTTPNNTLDISGLTPEQQLTAAAFVALQKKEPVQRLHPILGWLEGAGSWELPHRPKPWTLGRTVNGFTLGEGQEWYRTDWTEDMLPAGWRPYLLDEVFVPGDPSLYHEGWKSSVDGYGTAALGSPAKAHHFHSRTKRPLPAVPDPLAKGGAK